jgi:lipoate-protein ligase A
MYALVLSSRLRPILRAVDRAHQFVLGTLAAGLQPLLPDVACRGISDLVIGEEKFSGNSLRVRRDHLLYHGTVLYDFSLDLIERCLAMPPRQPDYRNRRTHQAFVTNLPLPAAEIRRAVVTAWDAREAYGDWPREATDLLVAEKYSRREWNEKH